MTLNDLIGKTIVGLALSDKNTTLTLMFGDGTAAQLQDAVHSTFGTGYAGPGIGGLRKVTGIAANLGKAITDYIVVNNFNDPNEIQDEYSGLVYTELHLVTSAGSASSLVIGFVQNAQTPVNDTIIVTEAPPIDTAAPNTESVTIMTSDFSFSGHAQTWE